MFLLEHGPSNVFCLSIVYVWLPHCEAKALQNPVETSLTTKVYAHAYTKINADDKPYWVVAATEELMLEIIRNSMLYSRNVYIIQYNHQLEHYQHLIHHPIHVQQPQRCMTQQLKIHHHQKHQTVQSRYILRPDLFCVKVWWLNLQL